MGQAPRAASIALALAGCALLVAAVARPSALSGGEDAGREVARTIEQRLRERAAAVGSRVATLSELPRLTAAVATDEATMRDLTEDELAFRPQPGTPEPSARDCDP